MEKYLTGMKRKAERDGDNETNVSLPKAKTRKYDEVYIALGFTVTTMGDEERQVCLLRLKMLALDSMKPNKLRHSFPEGGNGDVTSEDRRIGSRETNLFRV